MMRRFVVRCCLFLIPVIVALVAGELYMRHLPNSYAQKDRWMKEHGSKVEVLILGNSHGLFGIRPDCFPKKTYNLCQVSQVFEYDEYLLERYASQYKSLTDVFLIADNSNIFDSPLEQTEWFRCIYYRLYMDYPKHSLWSKYGFEFSNIDAVKEKWLNHRMDCDSLGWNRGYTKEQRSPDYLSPLSVDIALERHLCKDWTWAEKNREVLIRIADWCREHGLRLILLQAPVSKAYYSGIERKQLDFIEYCCSLPDVIVADYSQDERFGDDDFFDPDHLTVDGARKGSEIISDRFFNLSLMFGVITPAAAESLHCVLPGLPSPAPAQYQPSSRGR